MVAEGGILGVFTPYTKERNAKFITKWDKRVSVIRRGLKPKKSGGMIEYDSIKYSYNGVEMLVLQPGPGA